MNLYLVQCGQTEWLAAGRMQGRLSLPLSEAGVAEVGALADQLAGQLASQTLEAIYTAPCESCLQTAKLVAKRTGKPKVHQTKALTEVDIGLWQGMLAEEIKRRQPRVYRQWQEEPGSVTPPDGENFGQAYDRLVAALARVASRERQTVAVVVAPLAAAMLRCHLSGKPVTELWTMARAAAGPAELFMVAATEE
jgi:probable phosphoglycerate mutase